MNHVKLGSRLGVALIFAFAMRSGLAQDPQQYPPVQPQQQYPPAEQEPQQPPPGYGQNQPPTQSQYPPPAPSQYPPPTQGQYPSNGTAPSQYPPQYAQQPRLLPPQQLDQLVEPVALYPDGLLAQVLAASTFTNQIADAAAWAEQHSYLRGKPLADAIHDDNVGFDPSVQSLLPFPGVLTYMARYMSWTQALGDAVLAQRPDIMDAVQRMREQAYNFGYLRSNDYQHVEAVSPGQIAIYSADPALYYVPYYDPRVVYYRPRPGFALSGAVRFGPAITVGAAFAPWGWGHIGFGWPQHTILIDNRPWSRTWTNRTGYYHPYAEPYPHREGPRVEHHEFHHAYEDHHH